MDQEKSHTIELLNQDLYAEHDAILYYLTHAWTVAQHYGQEILEIAYDEMRHFKWLAHSIVTLGGHPDLHTPELTPIASIDEALQQDIDAEIRAIEQYEEHRDVIPDASIKALLERIITDERHHLHIFRELLARNTETASKTVNTENPEVSVIASRLQNIVTLEYQQMLGYLLQSFLDNHSQRIGLDMEERSIDEMRHMGWIGKLMGHFGLEPLFPAPQTLNQVREGTKNEEQLYHDLKEWAKQAMPAMIPTIDRIMEQEHYHTLV